MPAPTRCAASLACACSARPCRSRCAPASSARGVGLARFDGNQAIQSLHRQRPDQANLAALPPALLRAISLTELEVSRRVVETPRTSISRDTRNRLLAAQGAYLRALYAALIARLGEAAALAEFEHLLLQVV